MKAVDSPDFIVNLVGISVEKHNKRVQVMGRVAGHQRQSATE